MEVKVEYREKIALGGISHLIKNVEEFPGLWNRLYESFEEKYLEDLGLGRKFGLCWEFKEGLKYFAGYDIKGDCSEKLEKVEIEAGEYAVVKIKGQLPDSLHKGIKYLDETFLPLSGYSRKLPLNIEVYLEGDIYGSDYEMELWAPLIKGEKDDRN